MAGIILNTKFIEAAAGGFSGYLDYMARAEAVQTLRFDGYTDYMGDSEKSLGLFDARHDTLSEEQKKEAKKLIDLAQKRGSNFWISIVSFENEWLRENGIFDPDTGYLDEKAIRIYARALANELYANEGIDEYWVAAVHRNTDNIHIHIAAAEPNPCWEIGKGRCQERDGRTYQRGVIKPRSITNAKSAFVNEMLRERNVNERITDIVRGIISEAKELGIRQDLDISMSFLSLVDELPDDLRLYRYNNNAMISYRERIDSINEKILDRHFKDEMNELDRLLSYQESIYEKAYGDSSYYEHRMEDLRTRLGNTLLKSAAEFKKNEREYHETDNDKQYAPLWLYRVDRALSNAKKNMKEDIESIRNDMAYNRMIRKIEQEEESER